MYISFNLAKTHIVEDDLKEGTSFVFYISSWLYITLVPFSIFVLLIDLVGISINNKDRDIASLFFVFALQ
jgi:hypothetical protein